MKRALLVNPGYHGYVNPDLFPPLGLMRISSMLKSHNYGVKLVTGNEIIEGSWKPDKIFITSLYTWLGERVLNSIRFYKEIYPEAKINVGGVFASLNPKSCYDAGADEVIIGIYDKVEKYPLDYDIVNSSYSHIFTLRGCTRKCSYCVVDHVEGNKIFNVKNSVVDQIRPFSSHVMIMDNNFLLNPHHMKILDELRDVGKPVDFRTGLDCMFMTEELLLKLGELKVKKLTTAYDKEYQGKYIFQMNKWIDKHRLKLRPRIFMLYNYIEKPEDIYIRLKTSLVNTKASVFPMLYNPNYSEKNTYISPNWTFELLRGFRILVGKQRRNGIIHSRGLESFKKDIGYNAKDFVERINNYGNTPYKNKQKVKS